MPFLTLKRNHAASREFPSKPPFTLRHSRLPALSSNLPPLCQHVREQNVRSGHVDCQDSPERISKPFGPCGCLWDRLIHQPTLGCDAERVEHEEGVVPKPCPKLGHTHARQGKNKVRVTNDFGDGPGKQHSAVGWGMPR